MAALTTRQRNALPKSAFGLPGSRRFPMPNRAHAIAAKGRATQQVKAGGLSKSSQAKINAKANSIIRRRK